MTNPYQPYLTDDHKTLQQSVKDVAENEIAPRAQHMEAKGPHADRGLRQLMSELGWLGVVIDREWGGMENGGHVAKTLMLAQVSKESAAAGAILQASILGAGPIEEYGSNEMKAAWLPAIAAGEVWPTIAVTERDSGSHILGMHSTARLDGDDWIIDADKDFIGNVAIADVHCIVVRTGKPNDAQGLSAFLVEHSRPGVEVIHRPVMGLHGFSVDGLRMTSVRVPAANMIGNAGDGLAVALLASVVYGRLNLAAVGLGIHRQIHEVTTTWVLNRPRFGGHLSDLDPVRYHVAEIQSRLMIAELAAFHAAHLLDQEDAECDEWLFNAKLVNNRLGVATADEAKQLHGGHAARLDHPFQRLWRDMQLINAPAGPDDLQLKRLAETALGPHLTQWSAQHARSRRRPHP